MDNLDPNKPQDGTKPGENDEKDIELNDDDFAVLDDDASKKFRSVDAQRHKYKTRAQEERTKREALEKENAELKAKINPPAPKPDDKKTKTEEIQDLSKRQDRIELRLSFPNLTLEDEDVDLAFAHASATGKKAAEIVSGSFFQAYLADKKAKKAAADATPSPSNRSGNTSSFKIEDLNDPEKVAKMSDKEFMELSDKAGKGKRFTITHTPEV